MSWEEMQTIENNDGRREKEKLHRNISCRQAGMSKIVWTIKVMLGWSHHRYFFIIHINPFSPSKDKKICFFFIPTAGYCNLIYLKLGLSTAQKLQLTVKRKADVYFTFICFIIICMWFNDLGILCYFLIHIQSSCINL